MREAARSMNPGNSVILSKPIKRISRYENKKRSYVNNKYMSTLSFLSIIILFMLEDGQIF